ncbi:MAG: oligosaccharide flippase family protein [Candidatus Thiodiazotropha sp.]
MELINKLNRIICSKTSTDGVWVLSGFAINAMSSLVVASLLAKIFYEKDVAIYFLSFSFVTILSTVSHLGQNVAVIKILNNPNYIDHRLSYLVKMLLMIIVFNMLLAVILLTIPFTYMSTFLHTNAEVYSYITVVICWILFLAIRSFIAEVFRGFHDIKRAAIYQRILPNTLLMLYLILVYYAGINIKLKILLIAIVIINIGILIVGLNDLFRKIQGMTYVKGVNAAIAIKSGLPIVLGSVIQFLITQSPIWILTIVSSIESVAAFGVAARLAAVISMPLLIANNVLMPRVAKLFGMMDIIEINRTLNYSVIITTSISVLIAIIFIVKGEWLLVQLFSESYTDAYTLLIIMSIGYLINVVVGSPALVLAMGGKEKYVFYSSALAGILTFIICIKIIPLYGSIGAAIAASIGLSFLNICLVLFCYHLLNIKTYFTVPALKR